MLDKERLKEIETKYSILTVSSEENSTEYTEVDVEDLVFLIQNGFKQAERVEELEKVIGDLDENVAAFETLWLEEKRKNKRYKQALELIYKDTFYESENDWVSLIHVIRKRAEKALKGETK